MAVVTLKKFPDDLHREVRRLQLDKEDKGDKRTLEEIYIDLIRKGLEKEKSA